MTKMATGRLHGLHPNKSRATIMGLAVSSQVWSGNLNRCRVLIKCSINNTEQERLKAAKKRVSKAREVISHYPRVRRYFDVVCSEPRAGGKISPNQLLKKDMLPVEGMLPYLRCLSALVPRMKDLEILHRHGLIAMDPIDFLRWRLGTVIGGHSRRENCIRSVCINLVSGLQAHITYSDRVSQFVMRQAKQLATMESLTSFHMGSTVGEERSHDDSTSMLWPRVVIPEVSQTLTTFRHPPGYKFHSRDKAERRYQNCHDFARLSSFVDEQAVVGDGGKTFRHFSPFNCEYVDDSWQPPRGHHPESRGG